MILGPAHLRVVVLDLTWRELHQALDLDLVDDRVEDLLARAVALTDEHLHDHALLVLLDLSPRRIVAVLRRLRSWSATIGE